MVANFLAQQDVLEDAVAEDCDGEGGGPPPMPEPLYHPSRWVKGRDSAARARLAAFFAVNPEGPVLPDDEDAFDDEDALDEEGERMWRMQDPDGQTVYILRDERGALRTQAREVLCSELPPSTDEEGSAEWLREWVSSDVWEDLSEADLPSLLPRGGISEGVAALVKACGQVRVLLGFMKWCGARVSSEACAAVQAAFLERWRQKHAARAELTERAQALYDFGARPPQVASGQLIAHFTYLCHGAQLKGGEEPVAHGYFGLKSQRVEPRPGPAKGQDLHQALASGQVQLVKATGTSFGKGSLQLALKNEAVQDVSPVVRSGTIFQHVDWKHKQNLMVMVDSRIELLMGTTVEKKLAAYCMNLSCACSSGQPMQLTEFYYDGKALECQGWVWDHFQGKFGSWPDGGEHGSAILDPVSDGL
uniref:Uncharacterized protein n=1 Tax=Alexandrium monilatum TaxID=311494 RepID=A0A7S4SUG8_9DINO